MSDWTPDLDLTADEAPIEDPLTGWDPHGPYPDPHPDQTVITAHNIDGSTTTYVDMASDVDADDDGHYDVEYRDTNLDGAYDYATADTDGDHLNDIAIADTDYDGGVDTLGVDTDGDGFSNVVTKDMDEDGLVDLIAKDTDGDGVLDSVTYVDPVV